MPPKGKGKSNTDKQLDAVLREEFGIKDEAKNDVEKHNLGDTASLKRALTDNVAEIIAESGYPIDHKLTDIKIALGLLACAIACVGQFYPATYPHYKLVLLLAVTIYFFLSTILTIVAMFIEKDIITQTKPGGPSGKALEAHAKLPRFSDTFTLTLRSRDVTRGDESQDIKMEKSIGAYFDTNGVLVKEALKADVEKLLRQFEQQAGAVDKKTQ